MRAKSSMTAPHRRDTESAKPTCGGRWSKLRYAAAVSERCLRECTAMTPAPAGNRWPLVQNGGNRARHGLGSSHCPQIQPDEAPPWPFRDPGQ